MIPSSEGLFMQFSNLLFGLENSLNLFQCKVILLQVVSLYHKADLLQPTFYIKQV